MSDVNFKPMSGNVIYASSNGPFFAFFIAAALIAICALLAFLFLKAKGKRAKVILGVLGTGALFLTCWLLGFLWIYRDWKGP